VDDETCVRGAELKHARRDPGEGGDDAAVVGVFGEDAFDNVAPVQGRLLGDLDTEKAAIVGCDREGESDVREQRDDVSFRYFLCPVETKVLHRELRHPSTKGSLPPTERRICTFLEFLRSVTQSTRGQQNDEQIASQSFPHAKFLKTKIKKNELV
jgi:hypothetical protein